MASKNSAVINPQLEMAKQTTIHSNLRQEIICTTKDKMNLAIQGYRDAIEAKQKVATWGGVSLSLLLSLVTASTRDVLGFTAEEWKAIFVIALILSVIAMGNALIRLWKTRKERSIDTLCQRIMSGSDTEIETDICKDC